MAVSLRGVRTQGKMAPEISLANQRPADYVFSKHVAIKLEEIGRAQPKKAKPAPAATAEG
jgi:hypothetical protein